MNNEFSCSLNQGTLTVYCNDLTLCEISGVQEEDRDKMFLEVLSDYVGNLLTEEEYQQYEKELTSDERTSVAEDINTQKEKNSQLLAKRIEQFAFDRGEYNCSPDHQIWFIADITETPQAQNLALRSAVMRELYRIICGKEAGKGEETIDDIAKYLNDNLDYGDLDEEMYDRGEKLLNSLNKFDEFYNSLNDDSPSKKNSKRKNDIGIPF